jgi:NhaP-type Na+/H+ or K+/H+ antiporter
MLLGCVVCVCVSIFFPFWGINLSLPPPLLPFAENLLWTLGGDRGLASLLLLLGPGQSTGAAAGGGSVSGGISGPFTWVYLTAERD